MRRLVLPLLTLLVATPLVAQPQMGEWGSRGAARAFLPHGDVVYSADGRGVSTFDVSNPAAPQLVDFDTSGFETFDLALTGTGANAHVAVATQRGVEWYRVDARGLAGLAARSSNESAVAHIAANARYTAAASGNRIIVYELIDGTASVVAQHDAQRTVLGLAFVGEHLYASVDREGTYVFALPSFEWTVKLIDPSVGFALAGPTLWTVSRDNGLTALDVANPAAPQVLSNSGAGVYFLDGVAATGSRVFAFERDRLVRVFDVSDATKPALTATLDEWTNVIAADGDRLFLAGAIVDEERKSNETGKPLRIFDAATLALTGEYVDRAGPVSGVWTDGSLAYVVDPPYLRVLDISKTAEPRELSSILVPGIQDHIRVKNGLAVLWGRAIVNLVDVSRPVEPRYLGFWQTHGHPPGAAAITRDKFVEANYHSGFHIVDYSDPANPVQVGGRIWHYLDLAAGDDAVYLVLHGLLRTVEIVGGRTSEDRSAIKVFPEQIDVAPANAPSPPFLVARTMDRIHIYSLADRFRPVETASIPFAGSELMATGDGVAYLVRDDVLHRLSLTAPAAPVETAMRVLSPMQMSVAGEKIVVADRYSVRVFGPDTAPPPQPRSPKRRAVR